MDRNILPVILDRFTPEALATDPAEGLQAPKARHHRIPGFQGLDLDFAGRRQDPRQLTIIRQQSSITLKSVPYLHSWGIFIVANPKEDDSSPAPLYKPPIALAADARIHGPRAPGDLPTEIHPAGRGIFLIVVRHASSAAPLNGHVSWVFGLRRLVDGVDLNLRHAG